MAGGRDERVNDLLFEDLTSDGNPNEEGQVRLVGNDLVAYLNGQVKSLTSGTGGSDAKDVKVSVDDTTPGFLEEKVVGGNLVTVTTLNGGGDEDLQISVDNHASTHEDGGADEISVANLSGLLADPQTPLGHNSTHQNGGADEINVGGLSGLLADAQTPLAHNTTHHAGGTDEIDAKNLASDSALAADYFLVSDGAGGLIWQLAPAPGFGTSLFTDEDNTLSSTTSATYQNKLTLTTGVLPVGLYMLFAEATLSGSAAGTRIEGRITLDATTTIKEVLVKPNVADGDAEITTHKPYNLSGIHTVEIDFRKEGGAGNAQIRDARITLWRLT